MLVRLDEPEADLTSGSQNAARHNFTSLRNFLRRFRMILGIMGRPATMDRGRCRPVRPRDAYMLQPRGCHHP